MSRKLKALQRRKPKERVGIRQIVKEVAKETGFTQNDVKEVIKATLNIICKHILLKRTLVIPRLGILFPAIKPPRVGMALNGGIGDPVRVDVPPKWLLKLTPGEIITRELSELSISRKEIDSMYED